MAVWSTPEMRFSGRAADYARARPGYPDALVDLLEREVGLTTSSVMADVGSGTGVSALPFLRRGHLVYGIEPNAEMRAQAESLLAEYARFRSIAGSAEATTLPDASVDGVVVAQAFHWFAIEPTRAEFVRILRERGWVALLWNTRRTQGTEFLRGYEALLQQFGTDYAQVMHRTTSLTGGEATAGAGLQDFFRGAYVRHVMENAQELDLDGLRSRVRSASYVPAEGTPEHAALMAALEELFHRTQQAGRVRIEYDLEIFVGRLTREG